MGKKVLNSTRKRKLSADDQVSIELLAYQIVDWLLIITDREKFIFHN
jgi:hypothetical protein